MTMTLREEALKLHTDNNGKIAIVSKVPIATRHDLAIAYTPGVAEPCKDIKEDKTSPSNIPAAATWLLLLPTVPVYSAWATSVPKLLCR